MSDAQQLTILKAGLLPFAPDAVFETAPMSENAVFVKTGMKERSFKVPVRIGQLIDFMNKKVVVQGFAFGPFSLDTRARLLKRENAEAITLTDREIDILCHLYEGGEAGVSREVLLQNVWGYREDLETHTLETHIYRLRQKIEDDPGNPKILLTTESGYCLAL